MTQKEQLAALTARLDALETENASLKRTQRVDHGAIWLSKPEGKSDLSATLRCPSCEEKQRFYFKDTGNDGSQVSVLGHQLPVYRCTFAKADAPAESAS